MISATAVRAILMDRLMVVGPPHDVRGRCVSIPPNIRPALEVAHLSTSDATGAVDRIPAGFGALRVAIDLFREAPMRRDRPGMATVGPCPGTKFVLPCAKVG